jgi:hypothetical protein
VTESLFDLFPDNEPAPQSRSAYSGTAAIQGVAETSFPARVAALLRSRPIADAADGASRQDWPEDAYDISTLSLAAIDLVIAQQGFEHEMTYEDVLVGLTALARRASPNRPADEHHRVATFVIDALLNRAGRGEEFSYRISDYATEPGGHRTRQVRFRLLEEREDPVRGEPVLRATRDAINALIGGLEFDVDDEQIANEILLERQLAKGAFDAAERAATIARLLSVSLGEELSDLIKETRRDLRTVLDQWVETVPRRLDEARAHIQSRLEVEHRLQDKVHESFDISDLDVAASAARIDGMLAECQQRHEALHRQVIRARSVFLTEQNRQSFRPSVVGYLPDLGEEILRPLLGMGTAGAAEVTGRWLSDVAGPSLVPIPRLYQVIADLWTVREAPLAAPNDVDDEVGDEDVPVITEQMIATAERAVARVGLPARVSALVAACLTDDQADANERQEAAQIVALATLWCFSPEDDDTLDGSAVDLTRRVLGARAAADTDGTPIRLDGWDGDDLIVAAYADALENADPQPVITLAGSAEAD